jgi:hypothetical protein
LVPRPVEGTRKIIQLTLIHVAPTVRAANQETVLSNTAHFGEGTWIGQLDIEGVSQDQNSEGVEGKKPGRPTSPGSISKPVVFAA